MSGTPIQPFRRVVNLLRHADRRLFQLAIRWPTLSDEQIARALAALDGEASPPPQSVPTESGVVSLRPGSTSAAIAQAEARLRRFKELRRERGASLWWQRRLAKEELSLPFASWTVFARGADGEWEPSMASARLEVAEQAAASLVASGAECRIVAWGSDGRGRLVSSP